MKQIKGIFIFLISVGLLAFGSLTAKKSKNLNQKTNINPFSGIMNKKKNTKKVVKAAQPAPEKVQQSTPKPATPQEIAAKEAQLKQQQQQEQLKQQQLQQQQQQKLSQEKNLQGQSAASVNEKFAMDVNGKKHHKKGKKKFAVENGNYAPKKFKKHSSGSSSGSKKSSSSTGSESSNSSSSSASGSESGGSSQSSGASSQE